jgi:hypothetical protein
MSKGKIKLQSPVDVLERWDDLPRDEKHSANARKHAKLAGMKSIAEIRIREVDLPVRTCPLYSRLCSTRTRLCHRS